MGHRHSAHTMEDMSQMPSQPFRLNTYTLGRGSNDRRNTSSEEVLTESRVNGLPLSRVPRIRGRPVRLAVHWRPISDISPGESLEGLCGASCSDASDDSLSLRSITSSSAVQIQFISAVVSNFQLDEVPEAILQLRQLNWLDFTHNSIREIPPGIKRLSNLRRLACGNNQITYIPDEIGDLIHLTWLDFTHNHLTDVSPRLGELSNLAGLGLSDCRLSVFPVCITRLEKLMKLGIFNNMITRLPRAIRGLTSLVKLDVSNNLLTNLPKEIGFLQSLTWLNLSHNRLTSLPDELGKLVNLRELGLGSNRLTILPDLRQLTELVMLPVYSNQLASIGTWIGSLQKLEKLDLSCNCLVSIPREAFEIRTLQYLNAKRNQIVHISMSRIARDEITGEPYTKLRYLDLSENRLALLPYELSRLRIEDFRANDNVFRRMPLDQPGRTPGTRPKPTSLHVACVNALLRRAASEVKEEIYRTFETRRRYCLKRRMSSDGTSSPLIFDTLDVRFPRLHQANFKIPYPKLAEVVNGDGVPRMCAFAFSSLRECDRCHLTYVTQHNLDGQDDDDVDEIGFGYRQIDFLNYGRYVQLPFLRKFCSRRCMDAHVSETAWGNLRPVDASFVAVPSSEDLGTPFFPPMFNIPSNRQNSAFPAPWFGVSTEESNQTI